MKLITAVIRPEKCQAVKDALRDIGVNGMTITHVFGRGSQAGIKFVTRAGDIIVDELEKTKIETVVDDEIVDKAVDAIVSAAQTGKPGDGRLIVTPVERFVRIRQDSESPKE